MARPIVTQTTCFCGHSVRGTRGPVRTALTVLLLALAMGAPAAQADDVVVAATRVVTYFTVYVYYADTMQTWLRPVTLAEVYDTEKECRDQLKAIAPIIAALAAKGYDLVEGTACQVVGTLGDE